MEKFIKKQNNYLAKIVNAVNNMKIQSNQQELKDDTSTMREIIREEMTKIDYTEQIVQMNDMLTNLKDSYLELSNKIQVNNREKESANDENIIDFKNLKNRKRITQR